MINLKVLMINDYYYLNKIIEGEIFTTKTEYLEQTNKQKRNIVANVSKQYNFAFFC